MYTENYIEQTFIFIYQRLDYKKKQGIFNVRYLCACFCNDVLVENKTAKLKNGLSEWISVFMWSVLKD